MVVRTFYGDERRFEDGTSIIRAVPRLDGDSITDVIITHMNGERRALDRMAIEIKNRYTGSLYSTWQMGEP